MQMNDVILVFLEENNKAVKLYVQDSCQAEKDKVFAQNSSTSCSQAM